MESSQAPPLGAHRTGILVLVLGLVLLWGSPAGAIDGRAIYERHCQSCHGVRGRGNGPHADMFVTPPRNLKSGFLDRYSTDELVRRVRSGVPLELALDLPSLRARAGDVEGIAAHLQRLPTVDWRLVEEGEAVYLDRCELCHGRAGVPGPFTPKGARAPRDLSDSAFQHTMSDADLTIVVAHGRRGMPPLDPPVATGELAPLVAFVRLLSPGYVLYDRYCAACHGEDGHGAGSFAEESQRPTVIFDRSYFARRDPEQVRSAVWHMLDTKRPTMPHFRSSLTEDEARAVIDFLRYAE